MFGNSNDVFGSRRFPETRSQWGLAARSGSWGARVTVVAHKGPSSQNPLSWMGFLESEPWSWLHYIWASPLRHGHDNFKVVCSTALNSLIRSLLNSASSVFSLIVDPHNYSLNKKPTQVMFFYEHPKQPRGLPKSITYPSAGQ